MGEADLQAKLRKVLNRIERIGIYCFVVLAVVTNLAILIKKLWECFPDRCN
jgi:hypothetical protein